MIGAWSKFYADILVDVPGCAMPVVDRALLRASREFFSATRVWRAEIDTVITLANISNYDLSVDAACEIVRIESATFDGRPIEITSIDARHQITNCIYTTDRRTINLLPVPNVGGKKLDVEVSLMPRESANGVNNDLIDFYADEISTGAKARLMLQPEKSYSNPQLGLILEQRFEDQKRVVGIQSGRGFSARNLRVAAKYF